MPMIDPEQERRRLVDFYSHQMDGELEKVAGQAYELTDLAREALRAEISRRGLSVELVEQPAATAATPVLRSDPYEPELPAEEEPSSEAELELRGMTTIRQFRDLPEALLAKGSLESAGIKATLTDDNIVRLDWFWSNLMGGVKLNVAPEDVEEANDILDQPIPEDFDVDGVGEYHQPSCPKCQSLDVNFQEVAPTAYLSAALSVPIPFHRRAWRCHACDAEWEDDASPESTT